MRRLLEKEEIENEPITELKVGLDFGSGVQPVGRLATRAHIIYSEYHDTFAQ